MSDSITLKPGFLVGLNSSITGSVEYGRRDLATDGTAAPEGAEVTRWETTRVIDDPADHEAAVKARGKARSLITSVCVRSDFGLLCPESKAAELDAAIAEARAVAKAHNDTSTRSRIEVRVLRGRISGTDQEAVASIASEVRELLTSMDRGIAGADVEAIREAAGRAKSLAAMLDNGQSAQIVEAVAEARSAARQITKRLIDTGNIASVVVADLKRTALARARTAFLDYGAAPAAPVAEAPAGAEVA